MPEVAWSIGCITLDCPQSVTERSSKQAVLDLAVSPSNNDYFRNSVSHAQVCKCCPVCIVGIAASLSTRLPQLMLCLRNNCQNYGEDTSLGCNLI